MLSVFKQDDPLKTVNPSQAPTLGSTAGQVVGQGQGQKSAVSGKGSGFTNMQSYIKANEPESGQGNVNANLIRQNVNQANQKQSENLNQFQNVANEGMDKLQGTKQTQGFIKNAINDSVKFAQDQNNVNRFTNLRTGQEAIVNPNEVLNQTSQEANRLKSLRQQLGSQIDLNVGAGLQDFLVSQRQNPSQATMGENRLDRFIAQSTPSGVSAIENAKSEAERIRQLQDPDYSNILQLGEEINQDQDLLNSSGIQNRINQTFNPEQEFMTNLDKNQLGTYLGVDYGQAKNTFNTQQDLLSKINQTNQELEGKKLDRSKLQAEIDWNNRDDIKATMALNPWMATAWAIRQNQIKQTLEDIGTQENEIRERQSGFQGNLGGLDQNLLSKYNTIVADSKLNREGVLQKYDVDRLNKIKALSMLSGQDVSSLLQGGIQ